MILRAVLGISWQVLIREWFGDVTAKRSFQILGVVLLLHSILTSLYSAYTYCVKTPSHQQQQPASSKFLYSGTIHTVLYTLGLCIKIFCIITIHSKFYYNFYFCVGFHTECFVESIKQCSLCLDKRKHSSVTPCGHLFCWQCIHECLQSSQQCPLCRHPTSPSQVVPLLNYDWTKHTKSLSLEQTVNSFTASWRAQGPWLAEVYHSGFRGSHASPIQIQGNYNHVAH